jgi:hypothetical protein
MGNGVQTSKTRRKRQDGLSYIHTQLLGDVVGQEGVRTEVGTERQRVWCARPDRSECEMIYAIRVKIRRTVMRRDRESSWRRQRLRCARQRAREQARQAWESGLRSFK